MHNFIIDRGGSQKETTLSHLVERYARQKCEDRRDKIYSLLGLVEQGASFPVNYDEDVITLFMRTLQFSGTEFSGRIYTFRSLSYSTNTLGRALGFVVATFCKHHLQCRGTKLEEFGYPGECTTGCVDLLMIPFDTLLGCPVSISPLIGKRRDQHEWEFICAECMITLRTSTSSWRFSVRHRYCHLWIRVIYSSYYFSLQKRLPCWSVLDSACTGARNSYDVNDAESYLRLL